MKPSPTRTSKPYFIQGQTRSLSSVYINVWEKVTDNAEHLTLLEMIYQEVRRFLVKDCPIIFNEKEGVS